MCEIRAFCVGLLDPVCVTGNTLLKQKRSTFVMNVCLNLQMKPFVCISGVLLFTDKYSELYLKVLTLKG